MAPAVWRCDRRRRHRRGWAAFRYSPGRSTVDSADHCLDRGSVRLASCPGPAADPGLARSSHPLPAARRFALLAGRRRSAARPAPPHPFAEAAAASPAYPAASAAGLDRDSDPPAVAAADSDPFARPGYLPAVAVVVAAAVAAPSAAW